MPGEIRPNIRSTVKDDPNKTFVSPPCLWTLIAPSISKHKAMIFLTAGSETGAMRDPSGLNKVIFPVSSKLETEGKGFLDLHSWYLDRPMIPPSKSNFPDR